MSNKQVAWIVAALLFLAGAVIWTALPESCSHWQARYWQAYDANRGNDSSIETLYALSQVKKQKPAGCPHG